MYAAIRVGVHMVSTVDAHELLLAGESAYVATDHDGELREGNQRSFGLLYETSVAMC